MNFRQLLSEKGIILSAVFLFVVIIVLVLYLFDIVALPGNNLATTSQSSSIISNTATSNTAKKDLIDSLPTNNVNDSSDWTSTELPNSKIKVASNVQINATMTLKFRNDTPKNSSSGLIFDNGIKLEDTNSRYLSLFYFLPNKRWVVKFQAGKDDISYYPIVGMDTDKIAGVFSLAISQDGKNVTVTANKTKKVITLSKSLYDTTNQMVVRLLQGPQSNSVISELNYTFPTE